MTITPQPIATQAPPTRDEHFHRELMIAEGMLIQLKSSMNGIGLASFDRVDIDIQIDSVLERLDGVLALLPHYPT